MANSNNWGEIYKSTWWGDKAWSANTLFIDSAPPGFGLNLLKASEDMDNTIDWRQVLSSVVANSTDEAAPNGTDTAEKITFTDDRQSRIQQQIALEANTTYTFSVYAKVRTGTKTFRLRNATLGQAQQFTADTSWGLNPDDGRYSFSFTTGATATTHTLSIQNAAAGGSGEVFFWGAMLNEGATAGDYVKTEASVSGSAPTPAYSGFGDAFGGVTAYYSLRQFTEAETLNAIRVRRSSDDTEQDIGFDANGDLDTTALTTFVNEDVNQYTSDFSSTEDLNESNGTGAAAQSVGGVDDAYKFTLSGGSATHFPEKVSLFQTNALSYDISFDYYIPSGNTSCDGIKLNFITGAPNLTTQNSWTSVQLTDVQSSTSGLRFYASDGGSISVNGDGDVFYLKNIVVTQTTADGAVTTFYDQSGNGNNATNSTESEQPLIVSGGTLVEENGKAALEFDGTDDYLTTSTKISLASDGWYSSSVVTIDDLTSNTNNIVNMDNISIGERVAQLIKTITTERLVTIGFTGAGAAVSEIGNTLTINNQYILTSLYDGTNLETFDNGNTGGTTALSDQKTTATNLTIGAGNQGSADWTNGTMQEIILFASDQSTNRTGIETNINDHFSIYP